MKLSRSRALTAIAACLVAAAIAAGCGSDSGATADGTSSEEAGGSLTRAAFIKQADPICTKGNKRREKMLQEFGEERNLGPKRALAGPRLENLILARILPEVRRQTKELSEMEIPSGDEGEIEALVAAIEEASDKTEANPKIVLTASASPYLKANKMSREYGFTVCGQN